MSWECLYHLYWLMYLTDKDRPPSSNSQWDWEKHKDKVSQVLLILASQGERYFYQNNHPIICRPHSQARPLHQELKLPPPRVWSPHINVCHKIKQTYQKNLKPASLERVAAVAALMNVNCQLSVSTAATWRGESPSGRDGEDLTRTSRSTTITTTTTTPSTSDRMTSWTRRVTQMGPSVGGVRWEEVLVGKFGNTSSMKGGGGGKKEGGGEGEILKILISDKFRFKSPEEGLVWQRRSLCLHWEGSVQSMISK